jgi:tRNA/tmRNA/rRNA uracil-C5-methylase (TrmA/RlmC/RlmD family)
MSSGTGSNSIYLAKKGFTVTAIDISKAAISIAKQRAEAMRVAQQCTPFFLAMPLAKNFRKTSLISFLIEAVIITYHTKTNHVCTNHCL